MSAIQKVLGSVVGSTRTTNRARQSRRFRYTLGLLATIAAVAGLLGGLITAEAETVSLSDSVITNPAMSEAMIPLGRGRMAESGSLTALLYRGQYSFQPWAFFRDSTTGATSNVQLPVAQASSNQWAVAGYAFTSSRDLLVFAGAGPIVVFQYHLSGSPLPSAATLVSTTTFGDSDSRAGDFYPLASGGFVGVWYQQGASGPQGLGIAYRNPSGAWSTLPYLTFMPTVSSFQTVVQHPADGSVWVFNDPDAYGAIGAVHLTETASGLRVDWTKSSYIDVPTYGTFGPDPENPYLVSAADPSTGTIVLAYESDARKIFSTSPYLAGSWPAIARISASGTPSFVALPTYVERVSPLGLVVSAGQVWLTYRPIDTTNLTWGNLDRSEYVGGSWDAPVDVGILAKPYEVAPFGITRPEFADRLSDNLVHYQAQGGSSSTTTTSTTTAPGATSTKGSTKHK